MCDSFNVGLTRLNTEKAVIFTDYNSFHYWLIKVYRHILKWMLLFLL